MASKNVETYRGVHGAFNRRDFDAVVKEFAPSITYTDRARDLVIRTPQEFKDTFLTGWDQAFSDARVTEAQYIDGGDTVIALFVGRGKQDGPLGPFQASGKEMATPFCELLRFDGSGRVIGGEIYYDQVTMLTQLGHMPVPAQV